MRLLVWITALFLASSVPASAGPVAGLVAAVFAGVTAKAVALFALRLFASVGLSLLQQRRARRGRNRSFGLQVTATTRGELESETSIIGLYATKGHLIYHNSHGPNNKYYQTVIELGGLPGATFSRIMVDGVYSELGTEAHPDYGLPLIAKRDLGVDYAWIKVYDGTQTTADPTLVAKYAEDAETPWTEAHVGRGIPYAILTMEVSSKVWPNGAPEQRYEENGIPFYDPRLDSTVGGAGLHRWGDPTTWEPTRNPIVKIYNILRGIALYDGSIWGGEADAEDLPLWNWVPAMNACDVDVTGRPQYEAGYEIKFAEDTPGDVVNELLAACSGQIAEFGGFWYVQVGAPDIAVATITDDDLLVTDAATKDPFPELLEIFNRVTAKYVSPGALWNGVPLNMIRNATWEAEDGIARNFEMDLPAVFNPGQAGQLAEDALKDHRRWRRHAWPLPPDYAGLRPLNTVSVTSVWNDYDAKLFEVTEIVLDLHRLTIVTSLRERDPADFVINPTLEIPDRAQILPRPIPTDEGLPLFNAAARKVFNQAGTRAHAAVDVFWDASGISETIKGIAIECEKRETEEEVWSGTVLDVERGLATIQPVPALTNLRVRAKALADNRRGIWSAWIWITSDDVRVETADLADTVSAAIQQGIDDAATAQAGADTATAAASLAQVRADDAFANANTALVDLSALTTRVGDSEADITSIQAVKVDAAGAVAAYRADFTAAAGGTPEARSSLWNTAVSDINGFAAAHAGLTVQVDGSGRAGLIATSFATPNGGGSLLELFGDLIVADGTLSTKKLIVADGSGNLLSNGDFRFGDARGWATQPAWVTIEERNAASLSFHVANAPFQHWAFLSDNSAGADRDWFVADAFAVTAGDEFSLTAQIARLNANVTFVIRLDDENGTAVSFPSATFTAPNNAWHPREHSFTVPAGAVRGTIRIRQNAASPNAAVGDIRLIRKSKGATVITPEGITTPLVATGAIITSKINGRAVTDPQSFFENYGGGTKTPATSPSWNNATAFSVVVPDSGSILLVDCHINWLLNGGSTAASWGLQFLLNGVAFDSQGGSHFQELVPFRRSIPVSAGTHTITLQCQRGTTSTFLIQNVHSVVTILKR